ncbi:hypothetical protein BH10BAC5_BH10BAC5_05080 [soil metagenome]
MANQIPLQKRYKQPGIKTKIYPWQEFEPDFYLYKENFQNIIAFKEAGRSFVFLASKEASYITCQITHVIGGEIING